jgi:acyl-CoA thioesterase-2
VSGDDVLQKATLESLDGLLAALELQPTGSDRYRVLAEPGRFERVFGGQLLAQALLAASDTVSAKDPHSLHAYFVAGGMPDEPLELVVERVRDGRSMSTRQVSVLQGERTLLTAIASFHDNPPSPEYSEPAPPAARPEDLPLLQDWARQLPPGFDGQDNAWIERPPPLEMRIGEAPGFFGGATAHGTRSHWMRLPRTVDLSPLVHSALLAYASDYLLLDMVFRSHPESFMPMEFTGTSLDHSLWIHRPVRMDRWHLHTQETMAISGHRGVVRGAIHDDEGRLVASCVQEVLVRPKRPERV